MAKVVAIGQPTNDAERQAIAFFRDRLPESYTVYHNFEMRQGSEVFEIDLAILAHHAVYLVDVKGTRGRIDVYGSKWYPEERQPFHSPLAKLRNHAKIMSTLIGDSNPAQRELRKAHVQACVLLTSDDAILYDQSNRDGPDVTDYKRCLKYLNDKSIVPSRRLSDIRRFHGAIDKVIMGRAKPKSAPPVFGSWQVEEKLGGTDRYTEYRAKHSLMGKSGGMVRLRVYQTDPYKNEDERKEEFKKISNAYKAVQHMPPHPNVLAVRDLIENEAQDQVVLVTDDVSGQILRQHLMKSSLALTFDQKLQIMRDVLAAMGHAHKHEVIHRNPTPDAILVTKAGRARLTGFDYARVGKNRESTIAGLIVDDLASDDLEKYQSPECIRYPDQASIASDLYSAGIIFYEMLTGETPFENVDQMMEEDGQFPVKPSEHKPDLPAGIDAWLQKFCEFDPEDRHSSAAVAAKGLNEIILPEDKDSQGGGKPIEHEDQPPADLTNLPQDYILVDRFRIQKKLGSGGFGVAYKVFDSFADAIRVIKLVTKDRRSVFERLRREYKTLSALPDHPHVVKVIWADRMNDSGQTPYIVFEYVEGLDVSDLIEAEAISLEDSVQIVREATQGLAHLHESGVYHQDVKPSNLLLTDKGVRIIDFNVAVSENDDAQGGGGTRRYIPPDYDYSQEPTAADRIDRDLYALGITFYECLTRTYPFDEPTPPARVQPKDPKQFKGCGDLSSSLVNVLLKMIAPERKDRFASTMELQAALAEVKRIRSVLSSSDLDTGPKILTTLGFKPTKPNTNPYVAHLLTLYSQSKVSNAGTRGLDEIGKATYVPTFLDEKLQPALLKGDFRLVIISGNAGDGKTAFIQQFEALAEEKGAQFQRGGNGAVFQLKGHAFQSNYDGSQDEGDENNDVVLQKFFASFSGDKVSAWPENQTRIIAINEGRLVDFFLTHQDTYPLLAEQIQRGLAGRALDNGVAVINLNLRSVVAEPAEGEPSILERMISQMTRKDFWEPCEQCDIRDKCYAYHNALSFQDQTAGPKIIERLKMLYTITHLRGRLHITMRDLRSALAFMLVGTCDCDGIHQLYHNGGEENWNRILDGYYFNSWLGGRDGSADRLLALLNDIDVALVSNPELDRKLGFMPPKAVTMSRFSFSERESYDDELLETLFRNLPRDYTAKRRSFLIAKHRNYLSHMRRRHFFERRDDAWKAMLPYTSIKPYLSSIQQSGVKNGEELITILWAINRGEGLSEPERLGNQLALRVRKVERGTIRSYRLFGGENFALTTEKSAAEHPFLECLPQALELRYEAQDGHQASLRITLDIYEMLMRLNTGYQPSVEELEGFYLSLAVFKNVLSAAPYQEVLLTETGIEFFNIRRDEAGVLHLEKASGRAEV